MTTAGEPSLTDLAKAIAIGVFVQERFPRPDEDTAVAERVAQFMEAQLAKAIAERGATAEEIREAMAAAADWLKNARRVMNEIN